MKINFTLLFLFVFGLGLQAQNTYYWVGGTGPTSYTSTSNWNTQLDGAGVSRSIAGALVDDVLIFDGSNVGGSTPTTGDVLVTASSQTCGQLILQNNAVVHISRTAVGSATITIGGGTGDDLVVNAGSTLTLGGPLYNYDVYIVIAPAATGRVAGTVYLSPLSTTVHTRSYITSSAAGALVFETGAACHITDSTASSGFNASVNGSVIFRNGASLYYYSGRSPLGNNAATQYVQFDPGSNLYFRGSNVSYLDGTAYSSSSWTNTKQFANVYIENGATLKLDGVFYKADNMRVDDGATFMSHTSGNIPIHGNLQVDGVFTAPSGSTNITVMAGNSPQTISGTGTISIPSFTVANSADVALNKTISVANNANIVGKLDFGSTGKITGDGTFTSRVDGTAASITGNTVAGSYLITNISGALSGNAGLGITGSGLDAGTSVGAFSTSNLVISLSKPATATQTGASFEFYSDSATLITANNNGFNETDGSVTVIGTRNFQAGTNYVINAATGTPFGVSTDAGVSMTLGNVTTNAAVTTNYNIRLTGSLNLASGGLVIRSTDTLRILNGNAILGEPFGQSKYIVSARTGSNAGVLRMDNIATSTLFPVGTSSYYLPVTLTPSSAMDYAVSTFEGVTADGSINGTPVSPAQKATLVDAIWNVDRVNGSGNCQVALGWDAALEGSAFATYTDADVGIGRYNGTDWDLAIGSGDNTLNIASGNFSNFSPFIVTRQGVVLPVKLSAFNANTQGGNVTVQWTVQQEENVKSYSLQRNTGAGYTEVAVVPAAGLRTYSYMDRDVQGSKAYYRLVVSMQDGRTSYSPVLLVNLRGVAEISVYPNPVVQSVQVSGLEKDAQLRIVNSTGKLVYNMKSTNSTTSIDLAEQPAGIYVLEIISLNGYRISKTLIKK